MGHGPEWRDGCLLIATMELRPSGIVQLPVVKRDHADSGGRKVIGPGTDRRSRGDWLAGHRRISRGSRAMSNVSLHAQPLAR